METSYQHWSISLGHDKSGYLRDLVLSNPNTNFKESILFYLNEPTVPVHPVGESIAILAFYLMQQSSGIWLDSNSKCESFKLINASVVLTNREFIFGLRNVIHKSSGRRFSLTCTPDFRIPKFRIPFLQFLGRINSTKNVQLLLFLWIVLSFSQTSKLVNIVPILTLQFNFVLNKYILVNMFEVQEWYENEV